MPDEFVIRLNDTESEITSTLTDDNDAPINLTTAASVRFVMTTLTGTSKVDAVATVVTPAAGTVRYQWVAADTNTVGLYLAQWKVTWADAGIQTFPNDQPILVRVTPASLMPIGPEYVTIEEMKQTLTLQSVPHADLDLKLAITAASKAIDLETGRYFSPSATATPKLYNPSSRIYLYTDDFYDSATVVVSWSGAARTAGSDFLFHPSSGPPWDALHAYKIRWPMDMQSVSVTAKWGWPEVPAGIREATKILVARLFRRPREAAFGVTGFGIDSDAVYVTRTDPDVGMLLEPYKRLRVAA